ncbi:hypothetical protein BG006_001221 [Podila minutissima]|uniref:Uncharacterized protein n=1 Tax=Podila minutissima TaxID=64525 RepID=A0A9P5SP08_9FUNG|nr:hypothetical protein BG006_001221 [Podila minutissima]
MSAYPNEKVGEGELSYPTNQPPPLPEQPPAIQPYAAGPSAPAHYPGAPGAIPTDFLDPLVPRPNDILPLHPVIIQQRQIAATLPPCPQGGYHELRRQHALGMNAGTFASIICFPIVCCCVREETVCLKCHQKFDINLPRIN